MHTLIPIALAYVVAHYFSLLAYQGQATAYLVSDPLGDGSNVFGTATRHHRLQRHRARPASGTSRSPRWCSATSCGLTLAHDRALAIYDKARDATRSQYWMLAVMVAFTSLGLWLLRRRRNDRRRSPTSATGDHSLLYLAPVIVVVVVLWVQERRERRRGGSTED